MRSFVKKLTVPISAEDDPARLERKIVHIIYLVGTLLWFAGWIYFAASQEMKTMGESLADLKLNTPGEPKR